jgi:uncharacterized protein YggE
MRKLAVLCTVLFLMSTVSAFAEEKVYTLTVAGQAAVMAVPDEAIVSLSVKTERCRHRKDAKTELDGLATSLIQYLLAVGVPERSIKSLQRQVGPVYENNPDSKRRRLGYIGSQRFQVRVPLEAADELLDGLPDVANEEGVAFRVSNERELRERIVNDAIEDAQARAASRAKRLGIGLGPIVGFSESHLGDVRPQAAGSMTRKAERSTPQLPAGENELRVNVSITYRIEVPRYVQRVQ